MLFSVQLAPNEANTGTNILSCTTSHISSHFDHCNLTNAILPLTTALASQVCLNIV